MKGISCVLCVLLLAVCTAHGQRSDLSSARVVVEGIVTDSLSDRPIERVTVRVVGSGMSTITNPEGRYRLLLTPGAWELHFTHVAFEKKSETVALIRDDVTLDVALIRAIHELPGATVYSRAYDPAQRIIIEAIARKKDILNRLADYQYDAYTKFVVEDLAKEEAEAIFLIAESQTTAYWERPNKYKEVITARRQSGNIDADNNLVTVGQILNFNANRIEIGQYSLVTPTATDALSNYNYYLIDTVHLDGRPVFRLEVEPQSGAKPLFVGTIDIADSTFDVVAVDVGVNDAVRLPFIDSLRYSQHFAHFRNEFWMPVEIRLTGQVHLGMKLPEIPQHMGFAQSASLYSYSFEQGHRKGLFDEYVIEVLPDADKVDSVAWAGRQTIPLTAVEIEGYRRIDSIEALPPSLRKRLLRAAAASVFLATFGYPDIFHFNRAEGYYLGLGGRFDQFSPNLSLRLKAGYSFDREKMQHEYGAAYRIDHNRRLWIGGLWRDDVVKRPTIITEQNYNPTFTALGWKIDPFDYYHEKGVQFSVRSKLINFVDATLGYLDVRQTSAPIANDHSIFRELDPAIRDNPSIADGRLRALSGSVTYDSRPMMRNKGRDIRFNEVSFTRFTVGIETASPDLIDNDFDYRRYFAQLYRRQRTASIGVTTINAYGGLSEGDLPPQRYFTIDHGNGILFGNGEFSTLNENNFAGNRAAMVYVNHDFDRLLFRRSGLPLVKDIPFTLQVFGGAFWTDFHNHTAHAGDEFVNTTRGPYTELGFGLGNMTPFLAPFNFGLFFTWQGSTYDTNNFAWTLGFAF